ncbi:MAG: MOSC N-terminal beta barrel domain-containing protein [Myxococcota bacterium]|nr:MOSC N-terminal beta barrel domain-containing protein [Myxococcota bacterium]
MATLSQIFIYPVKSCAGIEVPEAVVTSRGLQFDRHWMVIDENGLFVTQREEPRMSQILLSILKPGFEASFGSSRVYLDPLESGPSQVVRVWNDDVKATVCRREVNDWFSGVLNRPVRVVKMSEDARRLVDQKFANKNDVVSFADGFPFLLLSQASIDELKSRLSQAGDVLRFRPNLVISGVSAHAEDGMDEFMISGIRFRCAKPCARCVIPTIDPASGKKDPEINKVLSKYRKFDGKILFGQNLVHLGSGTLQTGAKIEL